MTKLEAALAYASWGWAVLPLVPNAKTPASRHGVLDATTDPAQICRWWQHNPDFNIGIAAGHKSGIVVFDVDPRNGGDVSWEIWQSSHGRAPDGVMQLTAGGGQHYIADHSAEIRSCKLVPGVDLLADGRYFVAAPSTIDGRAYIWEASSSPWDGVAPATIPPAWIQAHRDMRESRKLRVGGVDGGLIQGDRNSGLTALGGVMRRYGMTEAEIFAALAIANETRCEIPLPSSEISQIARSCARYEPDADVAAASSVGQVAAEEILRGVQAEHQSYYLTRATDFLSQATPQRWLIKGWLPENAVAMIYGESGSGKTFVTLDMACHAAASLQWCGFITKPATVVYLAGEGHHGLRLRVAAWALAHGVQNLDNLLISNKAVDLDSPLAAAQVINAVRELTQGEVAQIYVDTLNNHMSGDENSARDTRAMLNACQIVARALSAAVCLVHHTGHAAEAKLRARGSSAWRASLDVAIVVTKDGPLIEVSCTKMKDAEPPAPINGTLQRVPMGWLDEDGEEIVGAVFVRCDPPAPQPKRDSKIEAHRKVFEGAWWASDAKALDGAPWLSREDALDYLLRHMGMSEASARQAIKPSATGRLIAELLTAEIVKPLEGGWAVIDPTHASSMLLRRKSRT